MEYWQLLLSSGITIFSFALLIISLLSYRKYKKTKILFISTVVLMFLLKGLLYSVSLFNSQVSGWITQPWFWVYDFVGVIFLYLVSLKS
jgi:hypothetical protein